MNIITWFWNMRHRKLIEETGAIIRLYLFLRHEVGLKEADKMSARELKELLKCISLSKRPFGDRI